MANNRMFEGSMVAIATPMQTDGSIDYPAFADLIEFHLESGSDALVVAGTTGESATLDFSEHCEVIRFAVEQNRQRVPLIAGTGANSTREALELTHSARAAAADACLLVTPYYNKPTQEGLYQHHKLIAESVAIPQILYNVPSRTACDMAAETVQRLSEVEGIVGIKEASGSIERAQQIRHLCGEQFAIYSGEDALAAEMILQGAQGVISVTANIAPALMHQMCAAALAADRAQAETLDQSLSALHKALFIESNPIPTKWALARMGLIADSIRLPLTTLSERYHATVLDAMKQAGIQC